MSNKITNDEFIGIESRPDGFWFILKDAKGEYRNSGAESAFKFAKAYFSCQAEKRYLVLWKYFFWKFRLNIKYFFYKFLTAWW